MAELANMRAVDDWPSVWSGPPEGGSWEFREWCSRYGWEPLTFDRQLRVRTPGGGKWTFYDRAALWGPLIALRHYAWQMRADSAAENSAVFGAVEETWPAFLDAAVGVLGAPTWTGAWDAPDFPEPPQHWYWNGRDERALNREPYRFAYWAPDPGIPGQPFIVLQQTVTFFTWASERPGGSAVSLGVFPPAEFAGTGR
ncbi:hypothetical protein [Streptomyces sp. NPDC047014]|uniref:hypothetical protein n=1 Tax=Streptomyces sp. NPDC047014 TaxID=3155736 RepID=UPI0033E44D0D